MSLTPPLKIPPHQIGIEKAPVDRRNQRDPMTCVSKPVNRIEQHQPPTVDRGPGCLGGNQKNPHSVGIVLSPEPVPVPVPVPHKWYG